MKHLKHTDTKDKDYKQFLALKREENLLHNLQRYQPYIEVEPFQKGWQIDVQIKDKFLTQACLKEAIDIGYSTKHISSLKHVKNIRRGQQYYYEYGKFQTYFPNKHKISIQTYDKFEPKLKQYFSLYSKEQKTNVTRDVKNQSLYYLIDINQNWLKLRVKPNIVTSIKQIVPEVESRLQQIRNIFEQKCYWTRFGSNGKRGFNINLRQSFKSQLHKYLLKQSDDIENLAYKRGWS
jgi:hypothetical protein